MTTLEILSANVTRAQITIHSNIHVNELLSEIESFDKTKLKNNIESIHVFTYKELLIEEIKQLCFLFKSKPVCQEKYLAITIFRLLIENRNILLDVENKFKQIYLEKAIEFSHSCDIFKAYYEYISFKKFPLLRF